LINFCFDGVENIKVFLQDNKDLCTPHPLFGGSGGISSYEFYGKLFQQFSIFDSFSKSLVDCTQHFLLDMWYNVGPPGSYVKPHNHQSQKYNKCISGVYYVNKPKNSGNLVLEGTELSVNSGDLVLFEDTCIHWTNKNMSNENRIVISFNLCK